MIQGSLDIVADKITIYHETAEADKIVAEGRPAKMKQLPALDEAHGSGPRPDYRILQARRQGTS